MKFSAFALLADENIHPEVIRRLREMRFDVLSVRETALVGSDDADLIAAALRDGRIVLTHDCDFGRLAVVGGLPISGIVYLRPGHIDPGYTIESLEAFMDAGLELTVPFIAVVERTGTDVRIRLRQLQR